jgi:hypothetical protein
MATDSKKHGSCASASALKDYVSAIGFYGDRIKIGHGSKGGWDVFGIEREVTRSEENVLFEIDGRSALSLYKDYLGELAAGLPANALLFPLTAPHGARTIMQVWCERSYPSTKRRSP